tara:strand:- start:427 stop:1284 length:858 start_codon:yes stop_codon:yes gene_type:complete
MTFNNLAVLKSLETLKFINKPENIINLGVQTLTISDDYINHIIKNNLCQQELFPQLVTLREKFKKNKKVSTSDFFKTVGFLNYQTIDINEEENSLAFDLNTVIEDTYGYKEKYDLVINNGTGEHVFNQFSLFKNMHNLCKKNGIMLHIYPFIDWINHGFYCLQPIAFADVSAANNYEILKISFGNSNGAEVSYNIELNRLFGQLKPNDLKSDIFEVMEFAKKHLDKNILIVSMLKKKSNDEFVIPLQGKYLSDVNSLKKRNIYQSQKVGSSQAIGQIPDNNKRKN